MPEKNIRKKRKRKAIAIPGLDIHDGSSPMLHFDEFSHSTGFSNHLQDTWRKAREKGHVPKPASQTTLKKP